MLWCSRMAARAHRESIQRRANIQPNKCCSMKPTAETRLSRCSINPRGLKMLKIAALILLATLTVARGGDMKMIEGRAHVVDGDTVVVGGVRVRLKGVDASELGTLRGEAARREMERIVGKSLACDLTGEKTWRRE